jgi:hypothetical protein
MSTRQTATQANLRAIWGVTSVINCADARDEPFSGNSLLSECRILDWLNEAERQVFTRAAESSARKEFKDSHQLRKWECIQLLGCAERAAPNHRQSSTRMWTFNSDMRAETVLRQFVGSTLDAGGPPWYSI